MGSLGGRSSLRGLTILIACGVLGLFVIVPAAIADLVVCGSGPGAGECSGPRVAVDRKDGLLYVAENGNRRVGVFDVEGTFLRAFGWDVAPDGAPGDTAGDQLEVCTSVCQAGAAGSGSGQFGSLTSIAVDNDELSTAFHDVYVFDGSNNRVQRFHSSGKFVLMFGKGVNQTSSGDICPREGFPSDVCQGGISGTAPGQFNLTPRLDLGPGGVVHVADNIGGGNRRVQKFTHGGALTQSCSLLTPSGLGNTVGGFAVDSEGNFYLANGTGTGAVRKYEPDCDLLNTFHPSSNIQTLAIDAADNLFVGDSSGPNLGGETAIYAYDPAATLNPAASPFKVFYGNGTLQGRPTSLAPYGNSNGDIFAAETGAEGRVVHVAFPPPGPVVHPDSGLSTASDIGNTKATLNARINPEGKASTFHFEYVDDATYQADQPNGFEHAKATAEAPVTVDPANPKGLFGLYLQTVEVGCPEPTEQLIAEGKCLAPTTVYHFRAVASNADSLPQGRIGPEATFETAPPFDILATWASEVGADAAKVNAEVNPRNIHTDGHFEYVEDDTFEESGFEEATETPEVSFGSGEEPVIDSAQLHSLLSDTLYRFRIVVENAFEFVEASVEDLFKTFAEPEEEPDTCVNKVFRGSAGAALPNCRAYEMVSPPDKDGGEIAVQFGLAGPAELTQSAAAVPAEGRGFAYSSYRSFGDAISAPYTSQYIASRHPVGDPEAGWSSHGISPPREGASFYDTRGNETQYKAFSENLEWGWLRSDSEPPLTAEAIPGFAGLYRRENATESYEALCPVEPENETSDEYVPDLGGFSADGSLAVFRANDKLTGNASSEKLASGKSIFQLYGCTAGDLTLVSVRPGGEANPGNAGAGTHRGLPGDHREDSLHNAVSEDGERIYWTDLGESPNGPGTIYLRENPFDEGGECAGTGAPCTVAVSESVEAAGADEKAQFWTASADGSVAIFSFITGPLTGNLYEFDANAETEPANLIAEGVSGLSGWSEDARRLYLLSNKALAPGAQEGIPNLYFYDASEGGNFTLVAAFPAGAGLGNYCSIDAEIPVRRCTRATADGRRLLFMSRASLTGYDNRDAVSGEPDAEVFLYDSAAQEGAGELSCISCNPSRARPAGRGLAAAGTPVPAWVAAQIPTWENSFYAPRVLSGDGRRLFFESFDSLVLDDTNGVQDVYQWEEAGKGDCEVDSTAFVTSSGGCLSLISSSESPRDSEFVDASVDGSDVFFKTAASLLSQDPGLIDIYDARVEGGFPTHDPEKPPCEGGSCQNPPAPPDPPSPASLLEGPRNAKPPKARRCGRGKRKVRRQGKTRCVKKHKRHQKRAHRPRRHRKGQTL